MKKAGFLLILLFISQLIIAQTVIVMSYNIRYDNPNDPYLWKERKTLIASQIIHEKAGIIGLQEALHHQNTDLQALLPAYAWVGVGRDDGKEQGEYCSIFYLKDVYTLLKSGTIALSETPDVIGSRSWDAALQRICSWVLLEDKQSHSRFYVFNTHFDHQGEIARQKSAELLSMKLPEISEGLPFILMGDFNCEPQSAPFKLLSAAFQESAALAPVKHGYPSTFNGWTYQNENDVIDHIFYHSSFQIKEYAIIAEHFNGAFASDHYPVVSVLYLKK